MRPSALIYLYARRLRAHGVQELLAGLGVAAAVALVLASTVAEQSISGSAQRVVRAVAGPAQLQLRARDGAGFGDGVLPRAEAVPGVAHAAGLLEQNASVRGPDGKSVRVDVAGTDVSLATLDGLARTLPIGALSPGGIGLSLAGARALGVPRAGAPVVLSTRGRAARLQVTAVLGPEAAGALSGALLAVMPLASMQRLTGLPHRLTRIFVQAAPGEETRVRAALRAIAGGRLTVSGSEQDVAVLRQALGPSGLASGLFAAIAALLGLLLAFNAILLTVPERRAAIADLRLAGAGRGAIVQLVLFQGLCLGAAASAAGLLAGWALSVGVFHASTGYLAEGFTLGGGTVIGSGPLLLAGIGGLAATCLASCVPLLDLRRGRASDAVFREAGGPGDALHRCSQRALFAAGLALALAAAGLYALLPGAAIAATGLLALATVCAVPLVLAGVLAAAGALAECGPLPSLAVAVRSLRGSTVRSLALAATGAVALFGSVALGGSRANLLAGIGGFARAYVADAPIWVINPDDNQAVQEIAGADALAARLARVPGVSSVRRFGGAFMDVEGRRVWVIARPPGAAAHVLRSQLAAALPGAGGAAGVSRLLASGGWAVVSRELAEAEHVGLGAAIELPTPSGPARERVAGLSTNLAWPPGVVFLGASDFHRFWPAASPSALALGVSTGYEPRAVLSAVRAVLGPASGVEASLAATRAARIDALTGEGLGQLRDIALLLLLAAVLAMASALGSSVWQRRPALAALRLSGAPPARLRRILLAEAALMLGAGCVTGAAAGVFGQVVIDGFLRQVTGFPLASPAASARPLVLLAVALAAALALASIPGALASRVPPALALGEE